MSRESRLIAILLVIAVIGVAGLMIVANQYRKALSGGVSADAETEDASARADRLVTGYLAARVAAKGVIAHYRVKSDDSASVFRIERFNAFAAHGMSYEDYAAVRAAWRTFRSTGGGSDPALVRAFQVNEAALIEASSDSVEAWDDAIR